MKKARAGGNDYWDKKLLEVEEKDPNRWRHTGYKKMYIEGESSSESERDTFRYNRGSRNSRSRSRNRKTSPSTVQTSPSLRKRASPSRRRSPISRPRSPDRRRPRSPSLSPFNLRKSSPPLGNNRRPVATMGHKPRGIAPSSNILPRSRRPPSPPPKVGVAASAAHSIAQAS